ncbi:NAD(P)H-dependent oxidoreductase [Primorskyibacter aestuariivivens]|uniref:FMN-dependent NADH-azoreductase n=1 Tax=Primorskyibacter aestuariivivens TaxID=1888912 RepID=UPI00230045BA|nr:NAD(P)H-dependent oxidoreductase [Primorskyibacter aestuariivivens]MDA7428462.1 NAD(P)H-dependent oxidoreductase [Primorskyibacter aestuariivivens]
MTTQTLLRIDASARRTGSVTRDLTDQIVAKLAPETVLTRDLADTPLPQIDEDWVGANFTPADDRSDAQKARLAQSDALVAELQAADTIVIGLPIYNFGVPAALKAWIDLVARAGLTFRYTADGPQGLFEGKRAILAVASGGTKAGSEIDFALRYMKHVLGFIGITEVETVAADRLAIDADATLTAAKAQVAQLAA